MKWIINWNNWSGAKGINLINLSSVIQNRECVCVCVMHVKVIGIWHFATSFVYPFLKWMSAVKWINSSSFKCQLAVNFKRNAKRMREFDRKINHLSFVDTGDCDTRTVSFLLVHSLASFLVRISNKLYKLKIIQTNTKTPNASFLFIVVVVAAVVEFIAARGEFFN